MVATTVSEAPAGNGGAIREQVRHIEAHVEDHESRLRELERAHWRMTAIVSVASAFASAAATLLAGWLK
jgi:hypothetical protein